MAINNTGFGSSSGPILASNISCNGTEYELWDCYNTTEIPGICTHTRDAAASCQPGFSESSCNPKSIIMCQFSLFILVDMSIAVDNRTVLFEGNNITLWCNAQVYSVANLTSYSWRNSRGEILYNGERINITLHNASYSDYYGDFIFNSSLTIFPLLPSDGDTYTCELTVALPRVGINITNTTERDIRVRGRRRTYILQVT